MEVLAVAIQKGGTGKTTTAAVLAQAAAHTGKKVLAIDLDPQGNLTFAAGADTSKGGSSYDLLHDTPAKDIIQTLQQGFDIIPASWNLATETTSKGSATRLKAALEPIKGRYDLIIIDTPPTAGELQYNALFAATGLIIPLEADIYSLKSLYQITDTAKQIMQTNKHLSIKGFIITQLDSRSTIAKQMQENVIIAANKNNIPYLGSIRTGVAIKEAAALQKNLYDYAPKSNPAKDYLSLLEQLI